MNKTIVVTDVHHAPYTRQYTSNVAFDEASFHTVVRSDDVAVTSGTTFISGRERAPNLVPQILDGAAIAYHQDGNDNISLRLIIADGNGGHKENAEDERIASVVAQSCSVGLSTIDDLNEKNKEAWLAKFRTSVVRQPKKNDDATLSGISIQQTVEGLQYSGFGIGDTMIVAFNPRTKAVRTLVPGIQKGDRLQSPPGVFNARPDEVHVFHERIPVELGDDFLIFGISDGVYEGLSIAKADKVNFTNTFTIDQNRFAELFNAVQANAPAEEYVATLANFAVTRVNRAKALMPQVQEARRAVDKFITETKSDLCKRPGEYEKAIRMELRKSLSSEQVDALEDSDIAHLSLGKAGDDCTIAVARVSPQAFQNAQRLFTDKKNTPFERFSRILPTWLKITLGILIPPLGLFLLTEPSVAQTRSITSEWKPWQRWLLAAAGISLIVLCLAAGVAGAIALFTGVGILPALPALAFLKLSLGPAIALTVGGLLGAATSSIWGMQLDPLGVWYDHKGENDYILEPPKPASETLPPPPAGTMAPVNGSAQPGANKEGASVDTSAQKQVHKKPEGQGSGNAHDEEYVASSKDPLLPQQP